jgi:hypothetical protein
LLFISLLVSDGLLFIGLSVGLVHALPDLAELTAKGTCKALTRGEKKKKKKDRVLTKGDAGVLLADTLTVLVGKEHVGRETALGSIGV